MGCFLSQNTLNIEYLLLEACPLERWLPTVFYSRPAQPEFIKFPKKGPFLQQVRSAPQNLSARPPQSQPFGRTIDHPVVDDHPGDVGRGGRSLNGYQEESRPPPHYQQRPSLGRYCRHSDKIFTHVYQRVIDFSTDSLKLLFLTSRYTVRPPQYTSLGNGDEQSYQGFDRNGSSDFQYNV